MSNGEIYMNNFVYAMDRSFKDMKYVVNSILDNNIYGEEERQELFFYIGTCLHWILDYAERLDINENDKKQISAFRYANNSLKHCIEIKEISSQRGGITFPIVFPLVIPQKQIIWSIVDNGKISQRNNYKEILSGKDVITTCEKVIELLMRCEMKRP